MDILGGAASITQLAVYTNDAWKICTRLYVELRGGPESWQAHRTNLKHLIQIISQISKLSGQAELGACEQIAELVHESFRLAEEALRTIGRANEKFFGVRWFSIGATEVLNRTFDSLKEKREFLALILQSESLRKQTESSPNRLGHPQRSEISNMDSNSASKALVPLEHDSSHNITLEMTSKQVGNGTSMISNNGLGHILDQIKGSVKLNTSSAGDGVAVNTNNVYMDPDVIKQQLEIAAIYAREHTGERRAKTPVSRARAKSAEPKQHRLTLNAS